MEKFKIKLRKIGNSKGIVIPKKYLKIIDGDEDEIIIEVNENSILLENQRNSTPRLGRSR